MKQVDKTNHLQTVAALYGEGKITQRAPPQAQRAKPRSTESKTGSQEFGVICNSNKNLIPYQ